MLEYRECAVDYAAKNKEYAEYKDAVKLPGSVSESSLRILNFAGKFLRGMVGSDRLTGCFTIR